MPAYVIDIRREEDEDDIALFMRRRALANRYWRSRLNLDEWDTKYEMKTYTWAGHFARLETWAPDRLILKVFRYRNASWITNYQATLGRQHHGRTLKARRWERSVCRFFQEKQLCKRAQPPELDNSSAE
jgi:hypothetical protein